MERDGETIKSRSRLARTGEPRFKDALKRRCAKRLAEQKRAIIERIRLRDQGGVSEMVGKSLHELSCGLV